MEETWRWFGPDDPIPLAHVRQTGAVGVVSALHHLPPGVVWPPAEIAACKALIEAAGLRWSVVESIPMPDAIKRGGAGARRHIDAWKDSLANVGRAGVPVVCYNFMPVVDWTRTDLGWPLPHGGSALRFDIVDFIIYDLCVLKRAGAEGDYEAGLVTAARARFSGMAEARLLALEHAVISGLPGGSAAQTRAELAQLIDSFRGMTRADMAANLTDFLREVVPVAEEVGVALGIHADDPPRPLFGLPRVVSTAADLRTVLAAVDRPANGLTFCVGSLGSRAENDIVAMAREFAPRIAFAHLRNVTLEPDGSFHEAEHLGGGADMVAVIAVLLAEERAARAGGRRPSIPLRPDHGHLLATDQGRAGNPGYSYIGRLRGLAELRGVIRALEHPAGPARNF